MTKAGTVSRLRLVDQLAEARLVLLEQRWRSLGSSLAVILGIGAAVATLTIAQTARHQVSAEFDALRATQVNVAAGSSTAADQPPLPDDADQRLGRLNGVVAAGVVAPVDPELPLGSNALPDLGEGNATVGEAIALGPGALAAAEPDLRGTGWSAWHEREAVRVALVGAHLADAIGLRRPDAGQIVVVDGVPFALAGIVEGAAREPRLLRAVLVPASTAARTWPGRASEPPHVLIQVEPGAAALIARQAPLALRPDAPDLLSATAPPDPAQLRQRVEEDVEGLFLLVAGIALGAGALGIGATTMVSVLERRAEFALRRTLGARPSHILRHVLTDTTVLGLVSAFAGTVAAVAASLAVSAARGWVPIVDPLVLVAGPLLGAVVGSVAGVPAARRASRAEPADAIRA